jgi:uncharacterized membrane protein YfcA
MADAVVILLSFLVAGWVQGMLGFGFAVTSTLMLLGGMNFTTLVFLNLCMSFLCCVLAMLSAGNLRSIHKPILLRIVISALVGLVIGSAVIKYVDSVFLKQVTLVVILVASLLSLGKCRRFFAQKDLSIAGGFLSGILTPSTGINGPLVMLHLNAALKDKRRIRSTMLSYLLVIMAFGILSMTFQVGLPRGTWEMLAKIVLPSVAGYALGVVTFRRLSDSFYNKLVTFFLISSSLLSLIYLIS